MEEIKYIDIPGGRANSQAGPELIISLRSNPSEGVLSRTIGKKRDFFIAVLLLTFSFFFFAPVKAGAAAPVAKFTVVEGQVDVLGGGALPASPANVNGAVFEKDMVRTKSASRAEVAFSDGSLLKIGQRSRIDINEYRADDPQAKRKLVLPRGRVEAVVPQGLANQALLPKGSRFEIQTPNAVAGVRGTDYVVSFDNSRTWVMVKEGMVQVFNPEFPDDIIVLNAGQMTFVYMHRPPQPPTTATEADKTSIEKGVKSGDMGITGEGVITFTAFDSPVLPPPLPVPPPAVEIGRTTLSGALIAGPPGQFDFISVIMKDVIFLAPSTGQAPSLWKTDTISGNYSFGPNIVDGVSSIPVSDGKGITGNFNIGQWGNNTWSGTASGQGNLSGGSYNGPVSFQGDVSGTHTGGTSGSFSGTGSGRASR